jgi:hypothetical protein
MKCFENKAQCKSIEEDYGLSVLYWSFILKDQKVRNIKKLKRWTTSEKPVHSSQPGYRESSKTVTLSVENIVLLYQMLII